MEKYLVHFEIIHNNYDGSLFDFELTYKEFSDLLINKFESFRMIKISEHEFQIIMTEDEYKEFIKNIECEL